MNKQSIDRRISRCRKKQFAANSELSFYTEVIELHLKTARNLLKARESFDNALETRTELNRNLYQLTFIPFPDGTSPGQTWLSWYIKSIDQGFDALQESSLRHQTTATERRDFYLQKSSAMEATIAMLKMQKHYEQQPAA